MTQRRLLFYLKNSNYEDIITFLSMYNNIIITEVQDACLVAYVQTDFSFSDFSKLREFLVEELLIDFVGLYLPLSLDIQIRVISKYLPRFNLGVYNIADFISEICLEKHNEMKLTLKSYYYNYVGVETVETVLGFIENSFNASNSAKKMYMHRNTLNYRIENFIRKTEIDIRDFMQALAIYLLFRR
jgi:hypothetical protein